MDDSPIIIGMENWAGSRSGATHNFVGAWSISGSRYGRMLFIKRSVSGLDHNVPSFSGEERYSRSRSATRWASRPQGGS